MKDFVQSRLQASAADALSDAQGTRGPSGLMISPLPVNGGASARPGRGSVPKWYLQYGKRALDLILVLAVAPLALIIIFFAAVVLWVEGGQPFYRQERLGRDGRVFTIWKLRSMVPNADALLEACLAQDPERRKEWETTQKLRNDPRVTRFGTLLRETSMDELPQLWNVMTGDMSLVGPRPMMPDQLKAYGDSTAYFAVRPGITGPWQVGGRNQHTFDYRAIADARYFATASFLVDMMLLLRTVGVVIRRTGY